MRAMTLAKAAGGATGSERARVAHRRPQPADLVLALAGIEQRDRRIVGAQREAGANVALDPFAQGSSGPARRPFRPVMAKWSSRRRGRRCRPDDAAADDRRTSTKRRGRSSASPGRPFSIGNVGIGTWRATIASQARQLILGGTCMTRLKWERTNSAPHARRRRSGQTCRRRRSGTRCFVDDRLYPQMVGQGSAIRRLALLPRRVAGLGRLLPGPTPRCRCA